MSESGYRKFERPMALFPLFRSVETLKGIGPRLSGIISKRIGPYAIDLLRHVPVGLIHRHERQDLTQIAYGEVVTLLLTPTHHDKPPPRTRRPYRILCDHATGQVELIFFHVKGDYLSKQLPVGKARLISGRAEWFKQQLQMAHPDHIVSPDQAATIPTHEPVYPLTAGLTAKPLRNALAEALKQLPSLPEWIDDSIKTRFGWPDWHIAMTKLHNPINDTDVMPGSPVRMRLAYDELFANQLALSLVRQHSMAGQGRVFQGSGALRQKLLASLPFSLTGAQQRVINEITADQQATTRMLRLLQGDVGAGKTMVAIMAMLQVVETGAQAAIIAPTEVLARQHFETISKILDSLDITPCLLVGRMKSQEKRTALEVIANGTAKVIIGTHALISEQTVFDDLGLVVIDEQHRFGVRQRLILGQKGDAVDVLLMTATPIPRTLAMTAYGDLNTSILDEKPANRQPITTTAMPMERLDDIVMRLRQTVSKDQRAYWICPLIEESDVLDVAAAEQRFTELSASLPELNPVLVHGRMKTEEREEAMEKFRQGHSCLLIATTVIEVGVDIPEATIMIIESAERFGLAQLHQLRGRVGRGADKSSCVLLYHAPLGDVARSRLSIMRETDDGFRIAAEDLRLRGPGEVLGKRQSGDPEFLLADLAYHEDLLTLAHDAALDIITKDATLSESRHEAHRILMALFERDRAVSYLAGG